MKCCLALVVVAVTVLVLSLEANASRFGGLAKIFSPKTPKLGPSGKPMRHFPQHPNRKSAKDAAHQQGGKNKPAHDTAHKPGQPKHFHSVGKDGKRIDNGVHHTYGKGNVRAGRKKG